MPLELTVIEGTNQGLKYRCEEQGTWLIGRSRRNQFSLWKPVEIDSHISKWHCLMEFQGSRARIRDLQSNNGIRVNDKRVAKATVKNGDRIGIGQSLIQVSIQEPSDENWSPPFEGDRKPLENPLPGTESNNLPEQQPPDTCAICAESRGDSSSWLCNECQFEADFSPQLIPNYQIVRNLRTDDSGSFYAGFSVRLSRGVLIRIIPSNRKTTHQQQLRFVQQAQRLVSLEHPNLVPVLDVGLANQSVYIVSDLIHSCDLFDYRRKYRSVSVPYAVGIACQALSGLKYLHEQNIIHGDIRTKQILLETQNQKRIARIAQPGVQFLCRQMRIIPGIFPSEHQQSLSFQAPEQLIDLKNTSVLSDQYSVAATLYFLLTGHRPYPPRKDRLASITQILREEPTPLRTYRTDLPGKLISVIHRALSRDPNRRYPNVREFRSELREFYKESTHQPIAGS